MAFGFGDIILPALPPPNTASELEKIKRILVSDSSKYGKVATFLICPLTNFDHIICDKNLVESAQNGIRELNINLTIV